MDDKSPIAIVLILFIILGLAYSPLKRASENRKAKQTASDAAIGQNQGTSYSSNQPAEDAIIAAEEEAKSLQRRVDALPGNSPFAGKIHLASISGMDDPDPSNQFIVLTPRLKANETVDITGWKLQSERTGYYATIPKAALLPFPYTHAESDVVLGYIDVVYIVKGFSPIGISFRSNKCTGYFEENRTFVPSLPTDCPLPIKEDLPTFSSNIERNDECVELIDDLPRCRTHGTEYTRLLPDTVTNSCKTYITTQINYNACVANHFSDTDFPGHEYWLYLNRFGTFWPTKRDKIILYDGNGLEVDSINY